MFVCFLAFFWYFWTPLGKRLFFSVYWENTTIFFGFYFCSLTVEILRKPTAVWKSLPLSKESAGACERPTLPPFSSQKRESTRRIFRRCPSFSAGDFCAPFGLKCLKLRLHCDIAFFLPVHFDTADDVFFAVYEIKNVLFWNWFFLLRMFCSFVVFGSCFAFLWFWDEICAVCCRHFRREEKSSLLRIPSAPKFAEYSHRRNIR